MLSQAFYIELFRPDRHKSPLLDDHNPNKYSLQIRQSPFATRWGFLTMDELRNTPCFLQHTHPNHPSKIVIARFWIATCQLLSVCAIFCKAVDSKLNPLRVLKPNRGGGGIEFLWVDSKLNPLRVLKLQARILRPVLVKS